MFYFKITERQKTGQHRRSSRQHFREFLRPEHLGEAVASLATKRSTTSVSVTKISQAAFVRATRGE